MFMVQRHTLLSSMASAVHMAFAPADLADNCVLVFRRLRCANYLEQFTSASSVQTFALKQENHYVSMTIERLWKLIILRDIKQTQTSAHMVLHLLHCFPSTDNSALQISDNHLKSSVRRIANSELSNTEWLQASITLHACSQGSGRASSLAILAFEASAASTLNNNNNNNRM